MKIKGAVLGLGLAVAGLAMLASPALAGQVGTAVVDGRIVILDSDGTWKYADGAGAAGGGACNFVEGVEFCIGNLPAWKASQNSSAAFKAAFELPAKGYYFGFIAEPQGSDAGMTYEALRTAILGNAAQFMGAADASSIPVLATEDSVPDKPEMRSITYRADFKGTPIVFYNCYRILPSKTIQLAFWTIGKEAPAEFMTEVRKFLANVKVN